MPHKSMFLTHYYCRGHRGWVLKEKAVIKRGAIGRFCPECGHRLSTVPTGSEKHCSEIWKYPRRF